MLGYFLGLTTIDLQYLVNSFPRENFKQKSTDFCINIGGPALNAAATFVRLGGKAKFFTVIGSNPMRPYILAEAEKIGIDIVDLSPDDPELPIMATVISNDQTGDRSILRNTGRQPQLNLEILNKGLTDTPDIALLDGFHMDAAPIFAEYVRGQSKVVVMDGGSWKPRSPELIALSDVAICSADFQTPKLSVFEYLKKEGVKYRAISRGAEPILFEEGHEKGSIEVPQVKVIDTLGAGDILHGAFAYYFAKGNSFQLALAKGAGIASMSTSWFGTRLPSQNQ
ncbi:MAG: PfkB family carbohydrate kinase [Bacteroidota bacterium]